MNIFKTPSARARDFKWPEAADEESPGGDLRHQVDDFRRRTGFNCFNSCRRATWSPRNQAPRHPRKERPGRDGSNGGAGRISPSREPASNRADRPAQACGGLVMSQALQVTKNDRCPKFLRQAAELMMDERRRVPDGRASG